LQPNLAYCLAIREQPNQTYAVPKRLITTGFDDSYPRLVLTVCRTIEAVLPAEILSKVIEGSVLPDSLSPRTWTWEKTDATDTYSLPDGVAQFRAHGYRWPDSTANRAGGAFVAAEGAPTTVE
jgi:hypothetical protein